MPSYLRFASVAAALLAVSAIGNGQGYTPRPQYTPQGYPQNSYVPGIPATGVMPGGVGMMPDRMSERMSVVDPDKKLSAGDQVTVEIIEDREGGLQRMVTATGELDVPPLGRVKVAGRTATQAASEIKTLLEKDYYYHATVRLAIDRVSPLSVRSGVIYLAGEIRMGGPQEILSGETLTLSNAILKAGGPTEWAKRGKVQITRQRKDGSVETIIADFDNIIKKGDAKLDPVLQDGDRIFIPKAIIRF